MKILCIIITASNLLITNVWAEGAGLYTEQCASCHGERAEGDREQKAPTIAGQSGWYLLRQLDAFRTGSRGLDMERDETGGIMRSIAEGLEEADIKPLISYISALPTPVKTDPWLKGDRSTGRGLYEICAACHGVKADGNKEFNAPRLSGLQGWYLYSQLQKFKAGVRGSDEKNEPAQQMKAITELISYETAFEDVAAFITSMPETP